MQQNFLHTEVIKTKNISLDDMDSNAVRTHILGVTRNFKNCWRNLAQALQLVWKDKLYREWGYSTFDQYTEKEITMRKHTAMKLIRSYEFLESEKENLSHTQENSKEDEPREPALTFEAANLLQRAKKTLGDENYQKVKKDLLRENKDTQEVKKDLTALILKRRKDLDPEKERTRQNKFAVNRFLAVLRTFNRDIETLKMLPDSIAAEIKSLIEKIEQHTANTSQIKPFG